MFRHIHRQSISECHVRREQTYIHDQSLERSPSGADFYFLFEAKTSGKGPRNLLSVDQSAMADTVLEKCTINSFSRSYRNRWLCGGAHCRKHRSPKDRERLRNSRNLFRSRECNEFVSTTGRRIPIGQSPERTERRRLMKLANQGSSISVRHLSERSERSCWQPVS
jgi:hypothetical protein